MPKGSNYFTVGFKQVWLALCEIRSLPQTFLYFVAFFLLADGMNTTGMISYRFHWSDCIYKNYEDKSLETKLTLNKEKKKKNSSQHHSNQQVSFSFLQITYLGLTQAITSITSTFGFWYIQKYFKIRTKSMFLVTNFFSVFIPFGGMMGLWTTRIGIHNTV